MRKAYFIIISSLIVFVAPHLSAGEKKMLEKEISTKSCMEISQVGLIDHTTTSLVIKNQSSNYVPNTKNALDVYPPLSEVVIVNKFMFSKIDSLEKLFAERYGGEVKRLDQFNLYGIRACASEVVSPYNKNRIILFLRELLGLFVQYNFDETSIQKMERVISSIDRQPKP